MDTIILNWGKQRLPQLFLLHMAEAKNHHRAQRGRTGLVALNLTPLPRVVARIKLRQGELYVLE